MGDIIARTSLFRGLRGNPAALERSLRGLVILIDAFVEISVDWLSDYANNVPRFYAAGLRYIPERYPKRGERVLPSSWVGEIWQDYAVTLKRHGGDCEDLVIGRLADLQFFDDIPVTPNVSGVYHRDNRGQWKHTVHIRVRYPSGRLEDPSRILGMKGAA